LIETGRNPTHLKISSFGQYAFHARKIAVTAYEQKMGQPCLSPLKNSYIEASKRLKECEGQPLAAAGLL
jgi:hypothetical protein